MKKDDEVEYENHPEYTFNPRAFQFGVTKTLYVISQVKLAEVERTRSELQEKVIKLQQEADNVSQQLEDAELKASASLKAANTMENQLTECQQLLEEETRQKLALSSKLRQLESEKDTLLEQLEEDEEAKKNFEKKIIELNVQMQDYKKKAEDDGKFAF